MKNLLIVSLTLATLLTAITVKGQDNSTVSALPLKGSKFINGQVGIGYNDLPSNFSITLAPGFGYFIRDNKALGARVGFYYNSNSAFTIYNNGNSAAFGSDVNIGFNPYGRKYYYATVLGVKSALFAEAGFFIYSFRSTPWSFYLNPGFAIFPHKHWAFELNLPNVFSLGATNGNFNFQAGLNLSRSTGFSVVYFLGKR